MRFLSPPCRRQPPGRTPTCRTMVPPPLFQFDPIQERSFPKIRVFTPAVAPFGSTAFFCLATPIFAKSKGEYHG